MRFLLAAALLSASVSAYAQEELPPTPIEPPSDAAPRPQPPAPAPPVTPAPDARVDEGSGCVPVGIGALLGWGIGAVLGAGTTCAGGLMANFNPTSNSDNCAEQCVEAIFAAFVIVIGVVVAITGVVILGPVAAIAATIGAALGAAAADRHVWPSVLGGGVGVLAGVVGVGMLVWGGLSASPPPFIAGGGFNTSDPTHVVAGAGLALVAASGLVSVVGATVADAVLGGPDESVTHPPPPPPASTHEVIAFRGGGLQAY